MDDRDAARDVLIALSTPSPETLGVFFNRSGKEALPLSRLAEICTVVSVSTAVVATLKLAIVAPAGIRSELGRIVFDPSPEIPMLVPPTGAAELITTWQVD